MNNHDQTKLEIAMAAEQVSNYHASMSSELDAAISQAFSRFATEMRERIGKIAE